MITIVDYGMGNLGSILNMFKRIGVPAVVESVPGKIRSATKLVLPGVGAFDAAMSILNSQSDLRSVLEDKVLAERVPILGVCLGMQLLTCSSEEGRLPGLGWIAASTLRIPPDAGVKVPHMGWNIAKRTSPSPLLKNVGDHPRYYFVHSYAVKVHDPRHSVMRTHYGYEFDSAIARDNIFGVQFHPEKSHRFGMQILKNFADL
jgi:imidazole glycerol-phosphate synthase subunit HisH